MPGSDTSSAPPRTGWSRRLAATLAVLASLGAAAADDSQQERRNRAGLRLFRTLLAADRGLGERTLPDGRLPVAFFYTDAAEQAAEQLEGFARPGEDGEPEPIKGLPLSLEATSDPTFPEWGGVLPAAVFIAQDPGEAALARIVAFGIENGVIVYSPYEGHVERGVLGGLAVGAQVRPYVNTRTLAASKVALKDFFLKVARRYP
jgi:hypothetical protein